MTVRAILAAIMLFAVTMAHAHDPFDGTIQLALSDEKVAATITLGYDAARTLLRVSGVAPAEAARITRLAQNHALISLPGQVAANLLTLRAGPRVVPPDTVQVVPNDSEIVFLITYPRPRAAPLHIRANYFDLIGDMRAGPLVVAGADRRVILSAVLTPAQPGVALPAAPVAGSTGAPGFTALFKLGVEHILTGYDHLLFLCALLLCTRRIGAMLGIVTAFTVSHSITLALAALDIATLPPAVVEPLIAASIIAVCLENVFRRDAMTERYWLAGGFGLLHGFGFAAALRDTALAQDRQSVVVPLLAFNLGVEAGQLAVAALFVPVLVLLRKSPSFATFGAPALSALVIAISAFWLVDRLPPFALPQ